MDSFTYTKETITIDSNMDISFVEITPEKVKSYLPFHWHDSLEILYIKSGEAIINTLSATPFHLYPENLFCMNPYDIHDMKTIPGTSFLLLMIPIEFLQKFYPDYNTTVFSIPNSNLSNIQKTKISILKELINNMHIALTFKEKGYLLRFHSLLFELMYQLYHNYTVLYTQSNPLFSSKERQRLQTIISYVHDHYKENISLNEISNLVYMQPHYFCHYFKKYFGKTFLNYVYEIRLTNIEYELINTTQSISYIASKHGFDSLDLFRKKFVDKNGCTPYKYRCSHREISS